MNETGKIEPLQIDALDAIVNARAEEETKKKQMIETARYYKSKGLTWQAIAKALGTNRSSLSRLVAEAKESEGKDG
jgi:DNA-binding transcriptional regulator LsrR (DeoR family)